MNLIPKKLQPYKDLIGNVATLVLVFVAILTVFYAFDLSDVRSFVDRFGIWAPVVFALTKASTIVFAPLSGSPLYPAAGALFGFWKGFSIIMLGDILGGSITFYISRTYGVRIAERFMKSEASLMRKVLDQLGTLKGFIFARLCFSPMPEIICYAAGLTKMSFWRFIVVHAFINIPMTAALVGAGSIFAFDMSPWVIAALLVLGTTATLAGGVWFYKQTK